MTKTIVKDLKQNIEFGDYDNYGNLIPSAFDGVMTFSGNPKLSFCIVWKYADGTNRTIKLCHDNPDEIDFESFGTTFEHELKKVGLSVDDVQIIDTYDGPRAYNIKDADGVRRPFCDFEIDYDFVDEKDNDMANHPKHRIGIFRSEEQARKYFKEYIDKYIWQDIDNLTFTPVEPDRSKHTD
jgi:hypothetical protein